MNEKIALSLKFALKTALHTFEEESGGPHNRRPEVAQALKEMSDALEIDMNALALYNWFEHFLLKSLTGGLKSFPFRDEYQLKKRILLILKKPEFSITCISIALYQESEAEKLQLYRLISKLEERLKNIESESERESSREDSDHQIEFQKFRGQIRALEEKNRKAEEKIQELEKEKWLKTRENILLSEKTHTLSQENQELREKLKLAQQEIELLKKSSESSEEKSNPHTLFQIEKPLLEPEELPPNNKNSCIIF